MIEIKVGDCRDELGKMGEGSVQCCVTSPPYWGLRDYGIDGQVWGGEPDCTHNWATVFTTPKHTDDGKTGSTLTGGKATQSQTQRTPSQQDYCLRCSAWRGSLGLEPTPELYVEHLVEIFREVKRVLRDDGVCWLNLGDSYATGSKGTAEGMTPQDWVEDGKLKKGNMTRAGCPDGLKPKDLCGIPWRVAFALQADGWYLRSDIIWSKPNCMPESVTDRPTKSHEYVFLLSKSKTYFYDAEAVKEDGSGRSAGNKNYKYDGLPGHETKHGILDVSAVEWHKRNRRTVWDIVEDHHPLFAYLLANLASDNPEYLDGLLDRYSDDTTLKKDVWTIPTSPFPGSHFAVFPPALIEPMIKAGTSERGCCAECGAGWVRVVEKVDTGQKQKTGSNWDTGEGAHGAFHRNGRETKAADQPIMARKTIDWQPTCDHHIHGEKNSDIPIPCTVLDPFAGAGTVGLVADRLQRDAILIELNPEYAEMARRRIENEAPMFANVKVEVGG